MRPCAKLATFVLLVCGCFAHKSVHSHYLRPEKDAHRNSDKAPPGIRDASFHSGCPFKTLDIGSLLASETLETNRNVEENPAFKNNKELLSLKILSPYKDGDEGCQNASIEVPHCEPSSTYRELDGSCNNLKHPTWGQAGECQLRFLPDSHRGDAGFPRSVSGRPLPQSRDLSLNIFQDRDVPARKLSNLFTLYGEYILGGDMVNTPFSDEGGPCCPYSENKHRPKCKPIAVGKYDPFYSRFNVTCMNFIRRSICAKCDSGKIQRANTETAAVDLSTAYGPGAEEADGVRLKDGTGRLRLEDTKYGHLIPSVNETCNSRRSFKTQQCLDTPFNVADPRVNLHISLASFQTLFMRDHNAAAKTLKEINPHWNGEKLYQEARKIVGAKQQSIVYKDYLPLLLGPTLMSHFDLWVKDDGTGTRYNDSTRLGIWIEASTAALRLHSMAASPVRNGGVLGLLDTFHNPRLLRIGLLEDTLVGTSEVPAQVYGRWQIEDMTNYIRQEMRLKSAPYGYDLTAITIQRSRDLGLPFYVDIVKYVTEGQVDIKSFDDLSTLMQPENIALLKQNYESVADVELWVGMNLEKIFPGSQIGFTNAVLIGKQFYNLKFGDRFYFEHEKETPSFTSAQRESIKKSSISRTLCANLRTVGIQRNAFLLPSENNPLVSCDELPDVDLTLWKSTPKME